MITVKWANEKKTIILWKFGESWTREEFHAATSLSRRLALSVEHTIHILVDISLANNTPSGVITLARTGMRSRTGNLGRVVVITKTHLWHRLYHYMEQVYPSDSIPLVFVKSFEEATEILPFDSEGYHSHQSGIATSLASLVR